MGSSGKGNGKLGVVAVLAVAVVVVAVWFGTRRSGSGLSVRPGQTQAFFTSDDGVTHYLDNADIVPPYQKGGKEAVRAYLFKCGDKEFVGYLERYTKEAQDLLTQARKPGGVMPNTPEAKAIMASGKEVKKPGDKVWVREMEFARSLAIMMPKCENKSAASPVRP
jgi:hypothetical protein